MRKLLSVLFIVLTVVTLSLAGRREEYIRRNGPFRTNNFERDFLSQPTSSISTLSLATNDQTIITLLDPNNGTCGWGEVRFSCLPDGYSQFNLSIPINITVEVQQRLKLREVYVWFGAQGTNAPADYTTWGSSGSGVSFAFTNLNGFEFSTTITLGQLISILTNPDGSYRNCFRIEVVVVVERYCGFSNLPYAFRHSPEGCDFDYQAIYPAADSYFHVALNNDGSVSVNNDTLYFNGYCLDPTRSVYPNYHYRGQIYSSYDYEVLNSPAGEFVEAPQNFPIVNYIANHQAEYLSPYLNGHQCTWQDIQNAFWRILFPVATANDPALRNILTNTSEDCVQWIVNDALAKGVGYLPHCPGGKYLLIIFPQLDTNGCNCTKDLETQLVAFLTGGACLNKCAPKVCRDVIRAGRRICLNGNCGPQPSPSVSLTSRPEIPSTTTTASYSNTASSSTTASYSSTASTSYSSTASSSFSSTASSSFSSTASTSYSSTASSSFSSTASVSYSSTPAPSQSSTPAPSASTCPSQSNTPAPSQSSTPAPSASTCPSQSSTPAPSASTCPSQSNTPAPSTSNTPCPSRSNSRSSTSAPSQSSTPCPSRSNSRAPSTTSTPCPSRSNSRSNTPAPSQSRTSRPSRTSKPEIPSNSPCHNMPSASPSNSPPCHNMQSASPSNSPPCHEDRPGHHGGQWPNTRPGAGRP